MDQDGLIPFICGLIFGCLLTFATILPIVLRM